MQDFGEGGGGGGGWGGGGVVDGMKKQVEHIWQCIGAAKLCTSVVCTSVVHMHVWRQEACTRRGSILWGHDKRTLYCVHSCTTRCL